MFDQYFGSYLLNANIISREQLQQAMDLLDQVNLKLGVLAINACILTHDQVEEIHKQQARYDMRFGELAIKLGYLDAAQVDDLLQMQKSGHLLLGQALLDQGFIDLKQLQKALEDYKSDCGLNDVQFESIRSDDIENIIKVFAGIPDNEETAPLLDYINLFVRNLIRFIDSHCRVEKAASHVNVEAPWLFYQDIEGDKNIFTGIVAKTDVFLEMAGRFAQEQFDSPDEMALASITEFLNLNNGIYIVNASNHGREMTMQPQGFVRDCTIRSAVVAWMVPVYLSFGRIDLYLGQVRPEF